MMWWTTLYSNFLALLVGSYTWKLFSFLLNFNTIFLELHELQGNRKSLAALPWCWKIKYFFMQSCHLVQKIPISFSILYLFVAISSKGSMKLNSSKRGNVGYVQKYKFFYRSKSISNRGAVLSFSDLKVDFWQIWQYCLFQLRVWKLYLKLSSACASNTNR